MRIDLPTGTLSVAVHDAAWPLETLCDFAARDNPKRGFLVVSKLLGRHIPARPATMRAGVRDLAARLPAHMPGPIAVIGLAETAVCLGQTIHEEIARTRDDALFLHSTRQVIDAPLLCRFEEPHSHASAHLLYRPAGFDSPRTLVLVDDEVSTGTTLRNLAAVLVAKWPSVERIVVATLTDWSGGDWLAATPRPATIASLLSGRLAWIRDPEARYETARFEAAAGSLGRMERHHNFGRLGRSDVVDDLPPLPAELAHRLRIVGTGEFTYPPFRLAERLEAAGHDVVVQATSRSPARLGAAMASKLQFNDNYGTGVANFLYNASPDDRQTLICHETPAGSVDPALVAALDARTLGFGAAA